METAAMFVQTMTLYLGLVFLQPNHEILQMAVTFVIIFINAAFVLYNVPIFIRQFYIDKLESKLQTAVSKIHEGEKRMVKRVSTGFVQTNIISDQTKMVVDES